MLNLQREVSLLLYLVLTLVCIYLTIEVTLPFYHVIQHSAFRYKIFPIKIEADFLFLSIAQDVFRFLERETSTKVLN